MSTFSVASARVRTAFAFLLVTTLLAAATTAGAAEVWLDPERLNPDETGAQVHGIGFGPDGTAHVLVPTSNTGPWHVFVARHRPGQGWEAPQQLSDTESSYGAIAVDGTGQVFATWAEIKFDGNNRIRWAYRPVGGAWVLPSGYLSPPEGDASGPRIAVDTAGNATVVWHSEEGTDLEVIRARTRSAAGGWGPSVVISGTKTQDPSVVADSSGRVTAIWRRYDDVLEHSVIESNHRTATTGWRLPTNPRLVSSPGEDSGDARLGVDGDGNVIAAWLANVENTRRMRAARRAPDQPWVRWPDPLSAGGQEAKNPRLGVGRDGSAVAAWARYDGNDDLVEAATLSTGGTWSEPQALSAPGETAQHADAAVAPDGDAFVVWSRFVEFEGSVFDDVIQVRRHGAGASEWDATVDLTGIGPDALEPLVAADRQGNVLAAWHAEGAVNARVLDAAGPATRTTRPMQAFSLGSLGVRWSAVDPWSDVWAYDVRVAQAAATSDLITSTWLDDTDLTTSTYGPVQRGRTYCFSARASDIHGNAGGYSAARCTAVPLNDTALDTSGGWQRLDVPSAYGGTASRTSNDGAALRSPQVNARRIALVATRAPGAGTVKVFLGNDLLRTISLQPTPSQNATRTYRKQIINVATFSSRRSGVVRIVRASGGPVVIEGLGVSAR